MPRAAPVTSATLPLSFTNPPGSNSFRYSYGGPPTLLFPAIGGGKAPLREQPT
jgi:hypothetical protein